MGEHCLRCDQSPRDCGGACPCLVDRVDITAHAAAGYCPHPGGPRFGDGIAPAEWSKVERVPVPPPLDAVARYNSRPLMGNAAELAGLVPDAPCGCAGGTFSVDRPK